MRLPPELRAGRVGALAKALPDGVRDSGFEVLLRRIDSAPVHAGNRVEVFPDGERAFAAMGEAVDAARDELLLESYIVRDDWTGRSVLEALGRAAKRGVTVRVLADAFGSASVRRAFWQDMEKRGIEVRLFHRLWPHLWAQPFRDHRKLLVSDRRIAFTGGMNIGHEYGSSHQEQGLPWRDTQARVEGPVAWEAAVVFREGWQRAGGPDFSIPPLEAPTDAGGARALVLDSRPGRGQAQTLAVLAAIVGAARHSLWITNPYFAPGRLAVRLLAEAAGRGVDVRLLLPKVSDVPIVRHAGHGHFAALLKAGVRIFEYAAAVLHAKSLVADARVSVVGSANLDFRSFRFNAECNVLILDDGVGRRMAAIFEEDLSHSIEILRGRWEKRGWRHRLVDSAAYMLSPIL